MKTIYRINTLIFSILVIALIFSFSAFEIKENNQQIQAVINDKDHKNTAAENVAEKKNSAVFRTVEIFSESTTDNSLILANSVTNASFMRLDKNSLKALVDSKAENISLKIPWSGRTNVEIELYRVNLIPDNFKILLSSGSVVPYKQGVYYHGVIKGVNSSMAAISFFENEVIGIISTDEGNFNLGSLTDNRGENTSEYILYNDRDLLKEQSFTCGVTDGYNTLYRNSSLTNKRSINSTPNLNSTVSPVAMYYVCDYQMFLDRNSNQQNVVNYVTAVFNQVKLLYQNEFIPMELSTNMFVYNTPDPYRNFTTSETFEILKAFGTTIKNAFVGDLAQLLSTRTPVMGAIAWIDVLCQSYEPTSESGRYAFSEIENNYNNVPIYSWTVEVITHETGHNFGSNHTQACVWPVLQGGGLGAIDSCVAAEQGNCFTQTRPNPNGTIMSYCHIPPGGGINFLLGFGPLPGDTIRAGYHNALCLDNPLNSSEQPLDFVLLQNYPNPFNPSTNIKFALPVEGLVTLRIYDLTGREIARLINNSHYPIGIFSYTLDASGYNLASGVYIYKLDVSSQNNAVYSEIKKMVLVK